MTPALTLSRRRTRTDETAAAEDMQDVEDLPPVADGRQQTTASLATKAATVGLLTCLALGPVGAVVGGVALLQFARPVATAPAAIPDQSNERAVVGQFAQQVVVTWLTATQDNPDALLALVKDAQLAGLARVGFTVSDPAVAGLTVTDGTWAVTISATVTDDRNVTAVRYFQVPVRYDRGTLSALLLPTPIAPPPVAVGASNGYRAQVDPTSPLGLTVGQFLSAYAAGAADVSRYLTPGITLAPLTPAPYSSVRVNEIRAAGSDQPPFEVPQDGTRVRVLALASGVVTDRQSSILSYSLTLTARAGRWEITAIDPVPSQQPSAPGATPAPDQSTAQPPGVATTTPSATTAPSATPTP